MHSSRVRSSGSTQVVLPASKSSAFSKMLPIDKSVHITSSLTLAWLLISIPLVIWDCGFVLLRPWTMPGGALHWPIWAPYEIYVRTDYIYGWKAIEENNGFTAAQGFMNIPETMLYLYYLYVVYTQGVQPKSLSAGSKPSFLAERYVGGRAGALALTAVFTGAVMTLAKTVLYGLNEFFSGYSNVGHNDLSSLVSFWIIPNGAWLVATAIMAVAYGKEIVERLSLAVPSSPEELSSVKND
ncbi:hypothetical protein BT63DRAFT_454812 [Microthyrium microscopicum]|uniref:C6 transcription factor n=1 Tax=Microthyrium microscopicum TaxID=703497 RepID=A0A6A6UGQ8_9PEZI|nr:hypothetical protein BT63DRAFT_454812 [Microthyrium microscopicum]